MPPGARAGPFAGVVLVLWFLVGCGGLSARTAKMRTALDAGRPRDAIAALDHELGVSNGALPNALRKDDALLVLDRATIQQSVSDFAKSKRDYETADKALDVLDLSHGAADEVGRWAFSDSAGRYVAPPHEKLLVNVLDMLNYLETGDLSGARVEARRMVVMSRYLRDRDRETDPSLGVGSAIAGFVFEKSGDPDEARRFYDDAARIEPSLAAARPFEPENEEDDDGEILVVVGDGRVPHRIAEHVPIGLALTRASPVLAAGDRHKASALAAHGLVTWVNFPKLAPARALGGPPRLSVDGAQAPLETALDVTSVVRAHWRSIEGDVMAAAITRAVARAAVGEAIETATKSDKKAAGIGLLLSLIVQASLSAADVPDTRSWETLPGRLSVARVRVPAGDHELRIDARGATRTVRVHVEPHGWAAATLFALR